MVDFRENVSMDVPGVGEAAKISGKNGVAIWAVVGIAGVITLFAANDNFGEPPEDPDDEGLLMKVIKLFKRNQ